MQDRADTGLSLVEVMVAMAVVVVGSLSLLSVLVSTTNGSYDNRARLTAANLAASDIDLVRSLPYASIVSTSVPIEKPVGGRTYYVERSVVVTTATGSATSACVASGGTRPLYKRVSTKVTTAFRGAVRPVRADTLVKAPVYQPADATKGAIGFLVMDRDSKPLNGLQVTASGLTTTSDSNGCSFFDGLVAGDHTVTVTRTGSVTRTGKTPMTKTVRVTPGQIASDSMRIDASVPLKLGVSILQSGTSLSSSSWAPPTNLKAQLATPDRATSTRLVADHAPLVTSAPVVVSWSAFPAPGGYEAYLGRCSPPVQRTDAEPGTTPPQMNLLMSPVIVHLEGPNSEDKTKTQNKTVTVSWRPSTDCGETLSYNVYTTSTCSPNSSGSDQCKIQISVPPGDWRFQVAGLSYYKDATVVANPSTVPTVKINV